MCYGQANLQHVEINPHILFHKDWKGGNNKQSNISAEHFALISVKQKQQLYI